MTEADVFLALYSFTSRIKKTKSFEEWEALDAEKSEYWDSVDEKLKELKAIKLANKNFEDKMLVWSVVLANK